MMNCKVDSQSFQCDFAIRILATSFTRLSFDAGRFVCDYDCSFNFVTMLAPWSASARSLDLAFG